METRVMCPKPRNTKDRQQQGGKDGSSQSLRDTVVLGQPARGLLASRLRETCFQCPRVRHACTGQPPGTNTVGNTAPMSQRGKQRHRDTQGTCPGSLSLEHTPLQPPGHLHF